MEGLLIVLFAVGIAETFLSWSWSVHYFRSGVPLYRSVHQGGTISTSEIDADKIEAILPESKHPKLLFRQVDRMSFIFRETLKLQFEFSDGFMYIPLMHGNLQIDPYRRRVVVIGRLNWFPLVFSIVFIISAVFLSQGQPSAFLMPVFLAGLLGFSYVSQKRRFYQVAELVSKETRQSAT